MTATIIGPYRIERELGRGGMGVVYLAHDTRLDRTVALKALPEEVARDPERLSRFEREAKLLASLNHTNIAAIYDVIESDGRRYLALEHIEGESLAMRLLLGVLPVEEAIEICLQIASGLEAAHERGVIHRDLKPGNVMITPDDQVKIVDFGLAKGTIAPDSALVDSPTIPASSPTITSPAYAAGTMSGVILGTAPYLSPEQARGKPVDRRTDIWSWGCILYECLTGKMAFHGETVSDTVAAILKQDPDWSVLPRDLPPPVRRLLLRCLEKDARTRLRDIGEARVNLGEPRAAMERETRLPQERPGLRRYPRLIIVSVIFFAAAISAYWIGLRRAGDSHRVSSPLVRSTIPLPEHFQLDLWNTSIDISPDEKWVVLAGQLAGQGPERLWLRRLDGTDVREIQGTEGASYPFWSPDGRNIGFFADQKLKRIPVEGGPVQVLCDAPAGRGASWSRNDVIAFSPAPVGGLKSVPASGGPATTLTVAKEQDTHRLPRFLPDGRHLLYFSDGRASGVYCLDLRTRKSAFLLEGEAAALPVAPGYLFYQRDENLLVQRLDFSSMRLKGKPAAVVANIPFSQSRRTGPYAVSARGTLLYGRGGHFKMTQLTILDSDGNPVDSLGSPDHYAGIRVSSDGLRVAVVVEGERMDLKLFGVGSGRYSERTIRNASFSYALSPDGKKVAFAGSNGMSIRSIYGADSLLIPTPGWNAPEDWSMNDSFIVFVTQSSGTAEDIWGCRLHGNQRAFPICATAASETDGAISPDGKWMVFNSDETGRRELYITTFPGGRFKLQVSAHGGASGTWVRGGTRILFDDLHNHVVGVDVSIVDGQPTFGPQQTFFGGRAIEGAAWPTPDGQRLVAAMPVGNESPSLTLVTNWRALLENK